MAKQKIYIKDWLTLKPYRTPGNADIYYLKLSNLVLEAIQKDDDTRSIVQFLNHQGQSALSCFMTAYFEDLITGTNLWNTFVKTHQEFYGKPLPLFENKEYFQGEINVNDLSFLIWYFLNTIQRQHLIAPQNEFIPRIAEEVYQIFDREWAVAPENEVLKSYYLIAEEKTDYYEARKLMGTILFNSYLFFPDAGLELRKSELELAKQNGNRPYFQQMLSENQDRYLHGLKTRLLGLSANEWAARIIGKRHPLYPSYLSLSPRIHSYFFYKGQDEDYLFLEHIATGKKFNLIKKSFDYSNQLNKVDTIISIGLVRWMEEWWFSGTYSVQPLNAELVAAEKDSPQAKAQVAFLDEGKKESEKLLKQQLKSFNEFTGGEPIVFLPSENINPFFEKLIKFQNDTLQLKKDERSTLKTAGEEGLFDVEKPQENKTNNIATIFFNPHTGPEIAYAVESAFPLSNNPFYKEAHSNEHTLRLLILENYSSTLARYCIKHCKTRLPFFKGEEGKAYYKDLDFLLRFWKRSNYQAESKAEKVIAK